MQFTFFIRADFISVYCTNFYAVTMRKSFVSLRGCLSDGKNKHKDRNPLIQLKPGIYADAEIITADLSTMKTGSQSNEGIGRGQPIFKRSRG